MGVNWKLNRLRDLVVVAVFLWFQNLGSGWCLNEEGLALLRLRERVVSDPFGALRDWNDDGGELDPCSWSGVECSDGRVVILNLKDLCLEGTLAPDLGNLVHIKSIVLRNNFFTGNIPEEIGELEELEVLDLGFNNFSGELPSKLGNNFSLSILLLDNNELLAGLSPEIHELMMRSKDQVDEILLSGGGKRLSCNIRLREAKDAIYRRLLNIAEAQSAPASARSSSPAPSQVSSPLIQAPPPTLRSPKSRSQAFLIAAIIVFPVIGVGLSLGIFFFFCRTGEVSASDILFKICIKYR